MFVLLADIAQVTGEVTGDVLSGDEVETPTLADGFVDGVGVELENVKGGFNEVVFGCEGDEFIKDGLWSGSFAWDEDVRGGL